LDKLKLDFSECERLMEEKNAQNAKLKARIAALEARATKLSEEAANVTIVRKDLEESRTRNKELRLQISSDHEDANLELLKLKQKLVDAQEEKEESNRRNLDTEDKLQNLRELEVEVVELRRTIKELQHQKREVTVKLTAAETDNEYLLNRIQVGDFECLNVLVIQLFRQPL
jgi:chromosome segregation ATPase